MGRGSITSQSYLYAAVCLYLRVWLVDSGAEAMTEDEIGRDGEPTSRLVLERPRLWIRTVALATRVTACLYEPKVPGNDGSIFACGGGYYRPPPPKTTEEIEQEEIDRLENLIDWLKRQIEGYKNDINEWNEQIKDREQKIAEKQEELRQKEAELARRKGLPTHHVYVPEGAMEWLLHEVGHWVAATPEERRLPDYGYGQEEKGVGKAREWQAWAFEEIILAPFGHSREFIPPKQRGGVAFAKNGQIPGEHLRHVERHIREVAIDVDEWRALYGEWIRHEQESTDPSWERLQ